MGIMKICHCFKGSGGVLEASVNQLVVGSIPTAGAQFPNNNNVMKATRDGGLHRFC